MMPPETCRQYTRSRVLAKAIFLKSGGSAKGLTLALD